MQHRQTTQVLTDPTLAQFADKLPGSNLSKHGITCTQFYHEVRDHFISGVTFTFTNQIKWFGSFACTIGFLCSDVTRHVSDLNNYWMSTMQDFPRKLKKIIPLSYQFDLRVFRGILPVYYYFALPGAFSDISNLKKHSWWSFPGHQILTLVWVTHEPKRISYWWPVNENLQSPILLQNPVLYLVCWRTTTDKSSIVSR